MIYLTILLTIFSTPPVQVRADLPPGLAGDSWGQEYCRQGLCAIMPPDRWHWCCDQHRRCCAYVEHTRSQDLFYFEKHEDRTHRSSPRPRKPTARAQEPPASVEEFPTEADQSSRSSQQPESPALMVVADQPRPEPQLQPPSFSQTKPGPDPAQTQPRPQQQPPRSYNEVLRSADAKMCRAKFCGLLTQKKHRRCCDLYGQCCAYANLRHYNDPFYFEKHSRNV